MVELTQEEFNALFVEYPSVRRAESGAPICPYCSNPLSPEGVELLNGSTEYGTPFCNVEITCDVCGQEVWRGGSWHGGAYNKEEQLTAVEDALWQGNWSENPLTFKPLEY
jgi:uncharacterized protein with PIN domain